MRTQIVARHAGRRALAGLAAIALPIGIVALTSTAADAAASPGSPIRVFVDSTGSADQADAITSGWWGHEGAPNAATGSGPSILDIDGSDPDLSQFTNSSQIRVAFVPSSSDGSNEHPAVTAGQSVDQVFANGWFMD